MEKELAIFTGCSRVQVEYGGHDDPTGILKVGEKYEIDFLVMHSSHCEMHLVGIVGDFNSVCFEFDEAIFDMYAEEWRNNRYGRN